MKPESWPWSTFPTCLARWSRAPQVVVAARWNRAPLVLFAILSLTIAAAAAEPSSNEAWLISTRRAPTGSRADTTAAPIDYRRLQTDRRWTPATAEEFFAGDDPSVPTTVFIHGSLVEPCDAIQEGWSVYNDLLCRAAGRPFRLVIWSWPSQRILRNLRDDVQLKACYSDTQAYYLACWLDRAARDAPVNLVGFSFGARVATGALHLAAGGEVAGRRLGADRAERLKPIRAVLVAAALDAGWLLPGHRNGLALSQVDSMLVTVNPLDPVLRRYPLMYRRGGPEALGYVGPLCAGQLGDEREKIETLNASCSVGRAHAWARYSASPSLRNAIARYAFFAEPPSTASAAQDAVAQDATVQDATVQDATVQDAAGPSLP